MEYINQYTKLRGYMVYPRFLTTIEVSPTAKIVYVHLLNRARSSQKKSKEKGSFARYIDEEDRVFIVYPIKELAEDAGISERWAKDSLKKLEAVGLIEKQKTGKSKPDRIYVKLKEEPK